MKICMLPRRADLGIGRVVEAYQKYMPVLGFEYTDDESEADIIAVHAGDQPETRQPHVHHCHGLYPTAHEDAGKEKLYEYNAYVIENARVSRVITTPSEWVADIFRRDMQIDPVVLPHGVDAKEWQYIGGNKDRPILWAKGHNVGVCDPTVLMQLAQKVPNRLFLTTFGDVAPNVNVIGKQSFENMRKQLEDCGIYLAVAKETFGIQTLEAMALGKPILGYDWGGTSDIITHGVDGYLAKPGDVDGLVVGLEWILDYYDVVSQNTRRTAEFYSWESVATKLAQVYESVYGLKAHCPQVSIIIPCYNYQDKVGNAIESALAQDFEDREVIVVNDGSTDKSLDAILTYKDLITIIDIENSGVAEARNCGIRHAKGEFITCLDSDDQYYQGTVGRFYDAIVKDRGLGIVYGALDVAYTDTGLFRKGEWPPEFCYKRQCLPRSNQVPSCNMFRKAAWERAGGFRAKYTPAEDADLWTRITTLGYGAKKITDDSVYLYDAHGGSLSRSMREPDYTEDKPWSRNIDQTPFAAPACEYRYETYPVRNYDSPWVSVVIPVGPGHEHIVWRALDSVWLQSMPFWECIVVPNGCGELYQPSTGRLIEEAYPWAKILRLDEPNVSKARNAGAAMASGEFLSFLDADDWYIHDYFTCVIAAYNEAGGDCYVYADYYSAKGDSSDLKEMHSTTFDCNKLKKEALHPITALVPKAWHDEIGGFDEDLAGWEDWDYYLKIAMADHCGVRYSKPLVVYDSITGSRRDESYIRKDELLPIFKERYGDLMCIRCPKSKANVPNLTASGLPPAHARPVAAAKGIGGRPAIRPIAAMGRASPLPATNMKVQEIAMSNGTMVKVIENSGNAGRHSVIGVSTRTQYGMKRHGEEFEMNVLDQRLQPHLYVPVVGVVKQASAPRLEVERPQPPRISDPGNGHPSAPPKIRTSGEAVIENLVEEMIDEVKELEHYNADEHGMDTSILGLREIRMLNLKGAVAADAYIAELEGKNRPEILDYLETRGIDAHIEFVDA